MNMKMWPCSLELWQKCQKEESKGFDSNRLRLFSAELTELLPPHFFTCFQEFLSSVLLEAVILMLIRIGNLNFSSVSFGCCISLVKRSLVFAKDWHSVDKFSGGKLDQGSDNPGPKSEQDSSQVHADGEGGRCEQRRESVVANHDVLNVQLGKQDDKEPPVVVNTDEDVEFSSISSRVGNFVNAALLNGNRSRWYRAKDTAIHHVEEIHHDETLEHKGLVLETISGGAVVVS